MLKFSSTQTGGIVLSLALIVFVLSLVAAGGMVALLWHDTGRSTPALTALLQGKPIPSPSTPAANPDDPLQPDFTVSPSLAQDHSELEKQLRDPLRAYYATKPERLTNALVEAADDDAHTTQVTLKLATTQGVEVVTFFYDRTGKQHDGPFPKWEASMLDNTK